MRIEDLQHFVDVAEHGSLTQAAETRGMSQPGLSRIVRELENQLGALLLRRTGRGIELTPSGERFLLFARETLDQLHQARQDIDALSSQETAHLRIAIPIGTGGLLAAELQRRFALQLPQIGIDVFEERTSLATDAMLMRRYDIALTYGYNDAADLGEDLFREDMYLVGAGDLAGATDAVITLRDAARLPLMLPPAGRFRSLIDRAFAEAGLRPQVSREFETSEAMLAYVMEREGVAILPYSDVVGSHEQSRLNARVITDPSITRGVRLLFDTARRAPSYSAVVQILRECVTGLAPRVRWRTGRTRSLDPG